MLGYSHFQNLFAVNNLLLEHVGKPDFLWVGRWDHGTFILEHSFMVAYVIIVAASVRKFGFGTLDLYFGLILTQTSDSGLQASDLGLRLVNNVAAN